MRYTSTDIAGVTIVDIEPHRDDRGFISRSFCSGEFAYYGLDSGVTQTSITFSYARGTLRGLHRQVPPYAEAKLVRCTRGTIVDVAVDVRRDSDSYGKHVMVQLSAYNHRALFLPPYVAHGYQTLDDNTEVVQQVSGSSVPEAQQGFHWNEPEFGIKWPLLVAVISEEDANWPFLAAAGSDTACENSGFRRPNASCSELDYRQDLAVSEVRHGYPTRDQQ